MTINKFTCPFCGRDHELVAEAEPLWGKAAKELHISRVCIPCQLSVFYVLDDAEQLASIGKLASGRKCGWHYCADHDATLLSALRKAVRLFHRGMDTDDPDAYRHLGNLCRWTLDVETRLGATDSCDAFETLDWVIRSLPYVEAAQKDGD